MRADLKCPHCDGQAFTDYGNGLIVCQRCRAQFDLNQQQCPYCGSLLAEGTFVCLQCGTDRRGDLAERIIKDRLMTPENRRRERLSLAQQARDEEEEEEAALKCPHCGSKAFTDYGDGLVACQRCYVQFDLNQQQCPHCGSLMAEGTFICLQCGTDLRGDLARRIIEDRLMTPEDRRRGRLSTVQQERTDVEEASRQRLEAWWEEERKRREVEHQEQIARQRRERNVLIITVAIIIAIILIITAISLIVFLPSQSDSTPTAWLIQQNVQEVLK